MDLRLLFVEQTYKFVVLLDGIERFDEYGLPGRGRTVNDSGNLAFKLGFDGDDEAVAADGDEVFLGTAAFAQAAQRFAQALFNRTVLAFYRSADTAKLRRCVVVEAAVGFDLATKKTQEGSKIMIEEG
jgi:hypothetical protein